LNHCIDEAEVLTGLAIALVSTSRKASSFVG
jgi:hypothetical protein